MKKIAIIGSGISGLSTAFALQEKGYDVQIFAKQFPPDITSNKAAAFWFPYHVRNDKRGISWCKTSYEKYKALCADSATGISMHSLLKLIKIGNEEAEITWVDFMPAGSYRILDKEELKEGYRLGYDVTVPLIETQIFLPWLINELKISGVKFIEQEIENIDDLSTKFDWVINCSGLGARELCNDESIYPARGQVALITAQNDMPIFLDNEQPMYIVPRKDATIIGGTYEENVWDTTPEPATIQRLYQQAVEVYPHLANSLVTGSWAGLRPVRKEVRLEKETNKNIIHNYGHGGSGFTLAWGCADEVVNLIGNADEG